MDLGATVAAQEPDTREVLLTNVAYTVAETGHVVDTPIVHLRGRTADGELVERDVVGFRPYFAIRFDDFRDTVTDITNDRRVLGVRVDCTPRLWADALDMSDDECENATAPVIADYLSEHTGADIYHDPDPYTTIDDEPCARIYCRVPGDVGGADGMRGDLDCETFEADIPFERRFLISTEIYRGAEVPADCTEIRYENWPGESSVARDRPDDAPQQRDLTPCEAPEIETRRIVYDIEVATEGDGFPQPDRARHPITAITGWDSYEREYVLWALEHDSWDQPVDSLETDVRASVQSKEGFPDDVDVRMFADERGLLYDFNDWVIDRNPDVITGYNADGFDHPYLIQRSYNVQARNIREFTETGEPGVWVEEYNGNREVNFTLQERCTLDILDAYKKTQFRELDSYKLDAVAEAELGFGKTGLAGEELDDAWINEPVEFFTYNVRDTQATVEVERESELFDLFENLREVTGAMYETAVNNGPMLDTLFLRRAYEKGLVLPSNTEPDESVYHGAKVFDVAPGRHKNCVYPDLSSLYPSLFAMLNLGKETIIGDKDALEASQYTEEDCYTFPVDERPFAEVPKGESYEHIDRGEYKGVKTSSGTTRDMFDPQYDWFYVLKPDIKESFITSSIDDLIDLKNEYTGDMYSAIKRVTNSCFTPDTDVITPTGVENIRDLDIGDPVYSLNPETNEVEIKDVVATQSFPEYDGELVNIDTNRSEFSVTPDHNMLLSERGNEELKFIEAGKIKENTQYKYAYDWDFDHGNSIDAVDLTDHLEPDEYDVVASYDCHGHSYRSKLPDGCNKKRANYHHGFFFDGETFKNYQDTLESISTECKLAHPSGTGSTFRDYNFDGDAFIEFLGWFITEGSIYRPEGEQTAAINIAQEDESHRQKIESCLDDLGLTTSVDDQGYTIGSDVYATALERLCGNGSENKKIPDLVFENASKDQKELLLETLMNGDGSNGFYYTSSDQLKEDVFRLLTELGRSPRAKKRNGTWEISVKQVEDGFETYESTVSTSEAENGVYCVTVEDNHTVLAGRNNKFQWVGQCYGVLGDSDSAGGKGSRLYNRRVAEGITLAGRMTITHTAEEFTSYLQDNYDEDAILVGGDTDSSVTSMPNAPDLQTAWEWAKEATEYTDESYDEFAMEQFGFDDPDNHRLEVELESLASALFYMEGDEESSYKRSDNGFLIKETEHSGVQKRYSQAIVWNDDDGWLDTADPDEGYEDALEDPEDRSDVKYLETVDYETFKSGPLSAYEPEDIVSITGFEYVRSDSAPITREAQLEIFTDILFAAEPTDHIEPYLSDLIESIKDGDVPLEKLARPKGINNGLDEYGWKDYDELDEDDQTEEAEANGGAYVQKAGPTYRGAKYVENWFDWEELGPGSKPRKVPIEKVRSPDEKFPLAYEYHSHPKDDRPDPPEVGDPVDAIAVEYPERVPDQFIIDYDQIIEKTLKKKLEGILSTMGMGWDDLLNSGTQSQLSEWG